MLPSRLFCMGPHVLMGWLWHTLIDSGNALSAQGIWMDFRNVGCPSLVVQLKYCPQTRQNRDKIKDGPGLMIMKTLMTQLWYDARLYDFYWSWILICWIETMNIVVGESLHGASITVVSWPFEMRSSRIRVITKTWEIMWEPSEHIDGQVNIIPHKTVHWVFRASAQPSHHKAPCWHIHWYFHGILNDALRTFFVVGVH